MKKRNDFATAAIATFLLANMTLPSWADGTVKVSLIGESMEKMDMKLSLGTVPAGTVTFDVTNDAGKTGHEMIVVKLTSKDQKLQTVAASRRIDEKNIKSLGEVSNLKPGAHGMLTAKLDAGDYILICNLKGHFDAGMYASLTVTP